MVLCDSLTWVSRSISRQNFYDIVFGQNMSQLSKQAYEMECWYESV